MEKGFFKTKWKKVFDCAFCGFYSELNKDWQKDYL